MRNRLLAGLAVIALLSFLIACGGTAAKAPTTSASNPTPTNPTPPSTTPPTTTPPTTTPAPTPAPTGSTCSYSFQTVDFPNADTSGTSLMGINDNGVIVGSANGHGLVYRNGQLTTFDVPASFQAFGTSLTAIANNGLMAGTYSTGQPGNSQTWGFLYDGTTVTKINEDAHATIPSGVNSSGMAVGIASFIGGITTAWIRQPDGTVQSFGDSSHVGQEYPSDINDNGVVIGAPQDRFYFSWQNGTFTYHDAPSELQPPPSNGNTAVNGNNNNGDIVGWWGNSGAISSFALLGSTTCTFTFPGASETRAEDINNSRVIVGEYRTGTGLTQMHGFIATPK